MLDRRQFLFSFLLPLISIVVSAETVQCPADSAAIRFQILHGSQIVIPISIDHSGPYDFILDTGSEITVMDPELAAGLKLKSQGSISMVFVTNFAWADLVKPHLVEVGSTSVGDLVVAVSELKQIQAQNPKIRGILGENFLSRFDLLVDYGRKMICLDQSKGMQREMRGERVSLIEQQEQEGDLAYTVPLLVAVHIRGDGKKVMILKIDSGSNAPILFGHRIEPVSWQERSRPHPGRVAGDGGAPAFAVMSRQDVMIGSQVTCRIAFLTPISTGRRMVRNSEDGLLPTLLFKRIFISRYADRFVVFNPW